MKKRKQSIIKIITEIITSTPVPVIVKVEKV